MTPSEREEIEKSVDRIMDKIMDLIDNDGRLSIDAEPIIAAEILTQVAKARACAIEECIEVVAYQLGDKICGYCMHSEIIDIVCNELSALKKSATN